MFAREYSGLSSSTGCFSIKGYTVKKMHSFKNAVITSTDAVEYYPFPVMRLADLYLLYAEALNEANRPGKEVFEFIDGVPGRAGLKGVRESWIAASLYLNCIFRVQKTSQIIILRGFFVAIVVMRSGTRIESGAVVACSEALVQKAVLFVRQCRAAVFHAIGHFFHGI